MWYQGPNNLSWLPLFDVVGNDDFWDVHLIAQEVKDILSDEVCWVCWSWWIVTTWSWWYHCRVCGASEGFGFWDEELGPRQNNLCEKFWDLDPDELSDTQIWSLWFFIIPESRFWWWWSSEVKVTEIEMLSRNMQKYYILIWSTKYRFQVNSNKKTISEFYVQRSTKLWRGKGKRWEKNKPSKPFQNFLEEKFEAKLADLNISIQ
jgi:hypothetical protein